MRIKKCLISSPAKWTMFIVWFSYIWHRASNTVRTSFLDLHWLPAFYPLRFQCSWELLPCRCLLAWLALGHHPQVTFLVSVKQSLNSSGHIVSEMVAVSTFPQWAGFLSLHLCLAGISLSEVTTFSLCWTFGFYDRDKETKHATTRSAVNTWNKGWHSVAKLFESTFHKHGCNKHGCYRDLWSEQPAAGNSTLPKQSQLTNCGNWNLNPVVQGHR